MKLIQRPSPFTIALVLSSVAHGALFLSSPWWEVSPGGAPGRGLIHARLFRTARPDAAPVIRENPPLDVLEYEAEAQHGNDNVKQLPEGISLAAGIGSRRPFPGHGVKAAFTAPESGRSFRARPVGKTAVSAAVAAPPTKVHAVSGAAAVSVFKGDGLEAREKETTPSSGAELSAAADGEGERSLMLEQIRRRIDSKKAYPPLARRKGWEGDLLVEMYIREGGELDGVRLLRESGYRILDKATLKAVRLAAPYPPMSGTVKVPVAFRLTAPSSSH